MFSCFGGEITTASFNNLQTIVAHLNLLTFNILHVTLSHWLVQYLIITANMPYKCYHYRKYFTCTTYMYSISFLQ